MPTQAQMGDIAPTITQQGSSTEWSVSITPRPLCTHFTGGWLGLRARLVGQEFRSPDRPVRSEWLYRLRNPSRLFYTGCFYSCWTDERWTDTLVKFY